MEVTANKKLVAIAFTAALGLFNAAAYASSEVAPPLPNSTPDDASVLSAEWWQWLRHTDAASEAGFVDCTRGQRGRTWFLAGTWGDGPIERTCSVPDDVTLFFPNVTAEFVNGPGEHNTIEQKREALEALLFGRDTYACGIETTIDGQPPVDRLALFDRSIPYFQRFVSEDGQTITDPEAVALGAYQGIRLSPGRHTVRIQGGICATATGNFVFESDVTYNLTVGFSTEGRF